MPEARFSYVFSLIGIFLLQIMDVKYTQAGAQSLDQSQVKYQVSQQPGATMMAVPQPSGYYQQQYSPV